MIQTVKQSKQTDTDHELLVFCILQNHPAVMKTLYTVADTDQEELIQKVLDMTAIPHRKKGV